VTESYATAEQAENRDEVVDILPKLSSIIRTGSNEIKVIGSFSFYDGSMVMISGRAQVFKNFR